MRMASVRLPRSLTLAGARSQRTALLAALTVTGGIIAAIPIVFAMSDGRIGPMELISDPAELTGSPWYLGAVHFVNVLIWASGAALYLVAAAGLWRQAPRRT